MGGGGLGVGVEDEAGVVLENLCIWGQLLYTVGGGVRKRVGGIGVRYCI